MKECVKGHLSEAVSVYEDRPREQWILDFPAQVALAGSQIWWTNDMELVFKRLEEGFESALKDYNKKQVWELNWHFKALVLNSGKIVLPLKGVCHILMFFKVNVIFSKKRKFGFDVMLSTCCVQWSVLYIVSAYTVHMIWPDLGFRSLTVDSDQSCFITLVTFIGTIKG